MGTGLSTIQKLSELELNGTFEVKGSICEELKAVVMIFGF
jgi:hypothetical protein